MQFGSVPRQSAFKWEKFSIKEKWWFFVVVFSNLLACPVGATSDGMAPCACAVDEQLNDSGNACERKSQTKSTNY